MNDLTTEEKITIIRNWCCRFDISHDRAWAKIQFTKGMGNYEYTPTCAVYDVMVDESYKMVQKFIWKAICDPI